MRVLMRQSMTFAAVSRLYIIQKKRAKRRAFFMKDDRGLADVEFNGGSVGHFYHVNAGNDGYFGSAFGLVEDLAVDSGDGHVVGVGAGHYDGAVDGFDGDGSSVDAVDAGVFDDYVVGNGAGDYVLEVEGLYGVGAVVFFGFGFEGVNVGFEGERFGFVVVEVPAGYFEVVVSGYFP